jgi:hypothetical protein
MNLVTHGAVSAVDVASAALARVCDAVTKPLLPSTRELDCVSLKKERAKLAKYPDLVTWLDTISLQPDWIELEEIRHQVTHNAARLLLQLYRSGRRPRCSRPCRRPLVVLLVKACAAPICSSCSNGTTVRNRRTDAEPGSRGRLPSVNTRDSGSKVNPS